MFPENTSKESKVTTNQSPKKLGHIVLSKRALQSVTKCLTKQKKRPQREKKLHPVSVGGPVVIIQSVGV